MQRNVTGHDFSRAVGLLKKKSLLPQAHARPWRSVISWPMALVGIDGYKNGWVSVWECDSGQIEVQLGSFTQIMERNPAILAIDIPIGLTDKGVRLADVQARKFLKTRGCCVFNAPLREMLKCPDHRAACKIGEQIEGKGISIQTWGIVKKINEVDQAISPESQCRIKEGHPEISFAIMNSGTPVSMKKRSPAGRGTRISLLRDYFPNIEVTLEKYRSFKEDLIDAYAMLWTARRIQNNSAIYFPENAMLDSRGLSMQIVA